MDNFDLKKYLTEGTLLKEVDESILGSIAKNLYATLKKMKANNPLDSKGAPLKREDGSTIEYGQKAKLTYQNSQMGLSKYGGSVKTQYLGKGGADHPEVSISYYSKDINAYGFVDKKEAEDVLKEMLKKYPKVLNGKVVEHDMSKTHAWAKHYAPKYTLHMELKTDQEIARAQSARPPVGENTDNQTKSSIKEEEYDIKEDSKNDYANNTKNYRDRMGMEKIFDMMSYYELDPSEVLEVIGQEYGIDFEFGSSDSRGSQHTPS
jgi:hypothetical protein|tara:strand:+ start:1779 stop:2567 length:789 start_codon:yes stop_codon:yes gene_type:complete